MRLHCLLPSLSIALAGCATQSINKNYMPSATARAEGIVILSISQDVKAGTVVAKTLVYINGGPLLSNGHLLNSREEGPLPGLGKLSLRPSEFPGVNGRLYAISLPAGTHQLTGWQIVNGSNMRIVPSKAPPALMFEVKAGDIKYIGSVHANLLTGKNLFGISITGDGYPEVKDERARDLAAFELRYPQFKGLAAVELLPLGPWVSGDAQSRKLIDPVFVAPLPTSR